jgi:hypothetical protein
MHVLLHCTDTQQAALLADMRGRRHYVLAPSPVIFLSQPQWSGHSYNTGSSRWQRDVLGATAPLGSGYGCFLMSWVGEGKTLAANGSGTLQPLATSVLETLEAKGIKYVLQCSSSELLALCKCSMSKGL